MVESNGYSQQHKNGCQQHKNGCAILLWLFVNETFLTVSKKAEAGKILKFH